MWVRKRIDITPGELIRGMIACFSFENRGPILERIHAHWGPDQTFTCLSVRSGFDLLLSTLNWPDGSEILMSGMTIPDMPKIVREHGLVPVGLDLDVENLSVSAEEIRRRITPQTKAIVVAHLFGGLSDLTPILEVAREHRLLVIEDCAQAYVGSHYKGDDRTDISMFSFGAIKTNSALAGGILVCRREELLNRLNRAHLKWDTQTRLTYLRRLIKYSGVKLMSTRAICRMIAWALRRVGKDHDQLAVKLSRGFSGGDFFKKIRQQPSMPLLKVLERKFKHFDDGGIVRRTQRGFNLDRRLRSSVDILGSDMDRPTYWVFPVLVENPDEFVRHLWKHGFDATTSCSLENVGRRSEASKPTPENLENVEFILEHLVFLPFDLKMPNKELKRLADTILAFQPDRVCLPESPALRYSDSNSNHARI